MALQLTVKRSNDGYTVAFPYDPKMVEAVKKIPNRKWLSTPRLWLVPKTSGDYFARFIAEVPQNGIVKCEDGIERELAEHTEKHRAVVEASRAGSADIELPCPDGLSYMPFQRAGIAYALRILGEI